MHPTTLKSESQREALIAAMVLHTTSESAATSPTTPRRDAANTLKRNLESFPLEKLQELHNCVLPIFEKLSNEERVHIVVSYLRTPENYSKFTAQIRFLAPLSESQNHYLIKVAHILSSFGEVDKKDLFVQQAHGEFRYDSSSDAKLDILNRRLTEGR